MLCGTTISISFRARASSIFREAASDPRGVHLPTPSITGPSAAQSIIVFLAASQRYGSDLLISQMGMEASLVSEEKKEDREQRFPTNWRLTGTNS